jgi:hypothetical protein
VLGIYSHAFTGPRVATLTRPAGANRKRSEPAQFNAIAAFQCLGDLFENGIDHALDIPMK